MDIEVDEAEQIGVDDVLPELDEAKLEQVTMPYEPIDESVGIVDEAYADSQDFATPEMTKERNEALTDKEKVEWQNAVCRMLYRGFRMLYRGL